MTFDEWWCSVRPFPNDMTDGDLARVAWIAALESREQWVSVEERLPEFYKSKNAVVRHDAGLAVCDYMPFLSEISGWCAGDATHIRVLFWRDKPAPPSTPSTEEKGTR